LRRRRVAKALLSTATALVLILVAAGLVGWAEFQKRLNRPFRAYPESERIVLVQRGQSVGRIAADLESAGVIESARLFRWHVRLAGDFALQAGEYRFDHPLSTVQVAHVLHRGEVAQYKITIREGLDVDEVSKLLSEKGFGRAEVFLEAGHDPQPIADLDPLATDLEGYLFPETYHFTRDSTENRIIETMVRRFREIWNQQRRDRAAELGLSLRQTVTLASLIEKETGVAGERPLVSAVFHNRLRLNINLGCDPTVVYAVKRVKRYDGVINRSDLDLDSPYNTYLHPGLPPGPITNPGEAAIDAALHPADADYLYFVSKNDGSHVFSRNYREHQRAVTTYQR